MRHFIAAALLLALLPHLPAAPPGYPSITLIRDHDEAVRVANELLRQISEADDVGEWRKHARTAYVGDSPLVTPFDRMLDAAIDTQRLIVQRDAAQAALDAYYGPTERARANIIAMNATAAKTLPLLDERERYAAILQSIHDGTAPKRFSYVDGVESYPRHVTFAARDGSGRRSFDESQFPDAIARLESILADIDREILLLVTRHGFPLDQPISRRRLDTHFAPLYEDARRQIARNDRTRTAALTTRVVQASDAAEAAKSDLLAAIVATDHLGWSLDNAAIRKPRPGSSARFLIVGSATNTTDDVRDLSLAFACYNDDGVRVDLVTARINEVRPGETAQYTVKVYAEGVRHVALASLESH